MAEDKPTPLEMLKIYKAKKEEEAEEMQEKIDIIEKYSKRKPPFTKQEAQEILTLCCYNNIGYCCGLNKGCMWRDTVMGIFGINPDEYVTAKKNCQNELIGRKVQ